MPENQPTNLHLSHFPLLVIYLSAKFSKNKNPKGAKKLNVSVCIYPTPLHKQEVTQGQFLSSLTGFSSEFSFF